MGIVLNVYVVADCIEMQLFSMLRKAKNLDKHDRLERLKMV